MFKPCIIFVAALAAVQGLLPKTPIIRTIHDRSLHLYGTFTYDGDETDKNGIRFYPKGGSLAVVSLDGMTVFRETAESIIDHATVLTSRPLLNNELFEVKVDRNLGKDLGYAMGIGVTTHSPSNLILPRWFNTISPKTWMLYDKDLYRDGELKSNNYGRGLHNLQPGERVGVMRTEAGNLHYFINGVDQGKAASDVPSSVYGVIDLTRDIAQVTIVGK